MTPFWHWLWSQRYADYLAVRSVAWKAFTDERTGEPVTLQSTLAMPSWLLCCRVETPQEFFRHWTVVHGKAPAQVLLKCTQRLPSL
jgi:hypothetical protein